MKHYRIYIDESGDHTYRECGIAAKRYLGLTGVVIDLENYDQIFCPKFEELKRYFPRDPDDPVIFHRDDIVKKRGPFWRLRDNDLKQAFGNDFLCFLESQPCQIITVVIDKLNHQNRYGSAAFHPYHYCLTVLLERYCGLLEFKKAKGDVFVESRGNRENYELCKAFDELYNYGTRFRSSAFFQDVLTSKHLKLKRKESNIAGLQFADLIVNASKQEILKIEGLLDSEMHPFESEIIERLQSKYNRQVYTNVIKGYGRIFLK